MTYLRYSAWWESLTCCNIWIWERPGPIIVFCNIPFGFKVYTQNMFHSPKEFSFARKEAGQIVFRQSWTCTTLTSTSFTNPFGIHQDPWICCKQSQGFKIFERKDLVQNPLQIILNPSNPFKIRICSKPFVQTLYKQTHVSGGRRPRDHL